MSLLLLALLQSDTLGGEWGGVRKDLHAKGLSWQLLYTGEVMADVDGGLDRGAKYMGLLDAYLDLDFDPMLGWTGGSARVNAFWLSGDGISQEHVGDLFRVSNIDAHDAVRVFEAWVQQKIGIVSLRAGLLASDLEFSVIEAAYNFLNGAFGALPTLSLNEPAPVYPLGALGGLVKLQDESGFVARAGLYEGLPGTEYLNETGLDIALDGEEGVLLLGEVGWAGEALSLKLGFFRHTGRVDEKHTAFYAIVQAPLWLGGPNAFVRGGRADDALTLAWSTELGVSWKGPIASRPHDELLLGFVHGRLSDAVVGGRYEAVVELSYRFEVMHGFWVQPDVQYVRHPGGTDAVEDAWVVGLRVDLAF